MAVFGPVRHQTNIIWTEASDMNYLLYYTFSLKIIMLVPGQSIYYRSIYENSDRMR
jgi:hypothetical protein